MMKNPLILLVSLFVAASVYAQDDTTITYFSRLGKETTKDSMVYYRKMFRKDNQWFGRYFYSRNNGLKMEGAFTDKEGMSPTGTHNNYKENGQLDYAADYIDGKLDSKTFYYKNGDKKAYITYNDKGTTQKGWDEAGKEIKNYVVEREASFKGGPEGWKKYLEKNLNANVAADAGAPAGNYTVEVQFVVSKEGYVSKVKATSVPKACKPCAAEAVNAILNGPQWEPAIQNNEPVNYQAIQYITFQVVEGKQKRKD